MTPYQHYQLLLRFERTFNLRAAIQSAVRPGDRVLDAGCGMGLLSLWAAESGGQVLAVDLDDVGLAGELARENGLRERIEFCRADLFELIQSRPELRQSFDVVIAMVYLNDPRRDERQSKLAYRLHADFLKPGGAMIPTQVRYLASPVEWPQQDLVTRQFNLATGIQRLSQRYGFQFDCLENHLQTTVYKEYFPDRLTDGQLARDGCRNLGPWQPIFELDYARDAANYPTELAIEIAQPGVCNALLWQQQLMNVDQLIFANESISWVATPRLSAAGDVVRIELDENWRKLNVLTLQSALATNIR